MTADGPRLIDWVATVRAPAALDLACCHMSSFPSSSRNSSTIRSGHAPTMRPCSPRYARLAGMSPAALTAAMEPYLPIVRVYALLWPPWSPAQRERLIQRVEAALCSED